MVPSVFVRPLLNQRPPKPDVTDQTAYAGVRFTYQVPEVTDADGDDLTYDAVQGAASNPLPPWLTFNPKTRTFTGRQRTPHIDTYTIRVYVSDGQQSSWAEFDLTVAEKPSNLPPTAAPLTAQTATEDQEFSYVVPAFSDPDNNTLTYAAALDGGGSLPGWLSFDATSRKLSGTPLEADTPASHTIRITATDDATPPLSSSATFTLTVPEVNDAPVPGDDTALVVKGSSVDVLVATLLANDSDPEGSTLSVTAAGGAVNGTVALSDDKSKVTYTHDGSETASGSFTYTVSDGTTTATGSVAVTVTEPNNAPVAVADTATVAEGGEVDVAATTLLANDTDADEDDLSITAVGSAVNGAVALSDDKSKVTYTHDGSETTTGSFTYTVSDGTDTSTGSVAVTVTPVNDAPTGVADTATVVEGGSVEVTVATLLSNDSDPEGDSFTFVGVGSAVNGTVALSEDKSKVTYTHDGSETTSGSYTYTVSDGTDTGTGTVAVTVTPVNDAPAAVDDTATVAEGGEVQIAVTTLLANDSDPEDGTLSVTAVGSAVNGTVGLSEDKSEVTYTHDGSETTTGSFTYTVSDGAATATGMVKITVTPVNDPPGALTLKDQTATVGASFSYQVPAVTDPDGDTLTYAAFLGTGSNPLPPGWLSFDEDTRTFSGTPREAHVGELEIQVVVTDPSAASKRAEFTLTVERPQNRSPRAVSLVAQTATEDQAFSYVVQEFDDPEDDKVTYEAALSDSGALPGWLSFDAKGRKFSGTPLEADTPAVHTIRVTATDDGSPSRSTSATFTLTVVEVNDAPVPANDTATVAEGGEVDIAVTALLANDSDPEAGTLSVTAVGGAVNGTVALSEDKSEVTYTHDGSETTRGSFTYTVSDGAATATGTVNVTVTPVNDPPGALKLKDQTATVGASFSYQVPAVTDPDGDTLTYAARLGPRSDPLPDWLSFDEDTRTLSGTPRNAHVGEHEIQVTVTDSSAAFKRAKFTLTVELPSNQSPRSATLVAQTATEDQAFSYVVQEFDDPEDDKVTYDASLSDGGTLPGWLSFDAKGRKFSGTPLEADTPAVHTIRVTATDDGSPSRSASATFTLTVVEVNDAPVPANDTATVAEGGEVDIAVTTLLANDSDPEDSTLSVTAVGDAVNGTVALSEDKSEVTYTHDGSETTTGSFTYTVSDGTDTATGTVNVTVTPANDGPVVVDDTATVVEGGEVDIVVTTLLANDSDPEAGTLSVTAVGGAVNGTVALSEDKSKVTYTHDGSETTTGSFTYTVSDGTDTATGTVKITVTPANDGPVVVDDTATVTEGGEVDIAATTLLANDSDPEAGTLSVTAVGSAVNGTVALSEDKSEVTYTHDGSETTSGSFTYTVSDGTDTATGTVKVTVTPANDGPVVVNDTATVAEGGEVDIAVTTLLANDSDPEAGTLSVTAVGGAVNGAVALSEDKSEVTYTHDGSETTSGSFTYTVSDGTATATGTVNVTVTPVNDAPGALTLKDQTATAGASFSYQVPAVTDPDGDALTYAAFLGTGSNPLPDWLSFDEDTRTFSGTPRKTHRGEYEIQVTVSDGEAATKKDEFTLTVALPPNRPPSAPALSPQSATEDRSFTYELPVFTDPDENALTCAAALDGGGSLPGWLSFNATSRTLSGMPLEADTPASHTIRITATDDATPPLSSFATFTLTVAEVNDAPSTPSLTDQDAVVSRPFSYTFAAVTDPEGGDVTYAASIGENEELPSWLSFDAANLTLSGTPGEDDAPAELTIRITATDDGAPRLASSASFTLTVSESNGAPQAVDDTAIVAEGHALTIASSYLLANDSDPDDQTLVITSVGYAVYGTATLAEDAASVTYRHGGAESTLGSFTYTVSDGAATDTATVAITVTPVNDPPSAPSVSDQTAIEDEGFSYRFAAVTDPENDGVTYTTALGGGGALPAWLSFNATTRTFSGTPREADTPATLTIVVTATDDSEPAESVTSTFTLTVAAVNDPPEAPLVEDRTAFVGEAFSYSVPAAFDSDSRTLAYAAARGPGFNPLPRWLRFDEITRTFSGTPLGADVAEHVIVVSVSDELHTTRASFTLTVELAANRPPVPPQIPLQEATEDLPFTFTVPPFTDPDEDLLEYAAGVVSPEGTVAGLPGWLAFESSSRVLAGTPRETDTPDVLTIVVTATDDGDPQASAEVRFTLHVAEVNDAPTASAGEDQTVPALGVVTLDGSGSHDPEGEPLRYAWSQTGEPSVEITGAETVAPTFVAPANLSTDVELVFTLVVTDVEGAESEPDSVSVRVVGPAPEEEPVVPVITIEAEIASVEEGQVASFRIEAAPSPDRPIAIVMDVAGGSAFGVADGQRDVFILPGDSSSILVLATIDDSIDEPQGRISATIRQQPLYTVGARSTAQVIVSDNDLASSQPALEATPESQRSAAEPTPEVAGESDGGSALSFGEAVVSDKAFIAGQDVGLVQLPGATGGQGLLSYELIPALPDGLRFDDGALTISGAPVGAVSPTRYTLSVADGEGRRAGLTFLITVLPEPAAVPTPTAAPAPEPTVLPSPTAAPIPELTDAPSPTAAPTPVSAVTPSPTAAPTPEPAAAPPPVAAPTPEPTAAATRLSDDSSPTSPPPSTATHTPVPTTQQSQSWTPAPVPGTPRPAGQPQPTESAPQTATTPESPSFSMQPPPVPTPTVEIEEPTSTAATAPIDDDQGSERMGWIVTTVLAGVTAATGGLAFLSGSGRKREEA